MGGGAWKIPAKGKSKGKPAGKSSGWTIPVKVKGTGKSRAAAPVKKLQVKPVKFVAKGNVKKTGTGKGKGKGKGKKRGLFSDLPEEKQNKIWEKIQARAEREGRSQVGSGTFPGTVVWRCRSYGWIAPDKPQALPKKVKESMATMTAELRAKAEENGADLDRFASDVLYFRISDRVAMDVQVDKDMAVTFQVYVDSKGAGAMDVQPA